MVQVNEKVLSDISHDEALKLLASSGPSVKLVLKHYKAATPFLLKQFGRSVPRVISVSQDFSNLKEEPVFKRKLS